MDRFLAFALKGPAFVRGKDASIAIEIRNPDTGCDDIGLVDQAEFDRLRDDGYTPWAQKLPGGRFLYRMKRD